MSAKRAVQAITLPKDEVLHGTFGRAPTKVEGASIVVDPQAKPSRKKPAEYDYMEFYIPRKASRAQVYAMVDRWLNNGRGRGGK